MNTLTQFIDAQLSLSQHLTAGERLGIDEAAATGLYEIIENEEISSRHFKGLAVSGSLFSLTTFTEVTFESCVFYASKFENCTFINCKFIDCKFDFTGLQHCRFNRCTLEDSTFSVSPIKKCSLVFSEFDHKFAYYLNKDENKVVSCTELEPLTWEEALELELTDPELEIDSSICAEGAEDEVTASLKIDLIGAVKEVLTNFKAA